MLDVIVVLDKLKIPYAIIGAMAASYYGVVRASMDADIMVSLSGKNAGDLLNHLRRLAVTLIERKGDMQDPVRGVIAVEDSFGNRVDLLLGLRGMDPSLFQRVVQSSFQNVLINVAGVEDFIAMKIYAGGPKDLDDVRNVLKVSKDNIDKPLLNRLTKRYGKSAVKALASLKGYLH